METRSHFAMIGAFTLAVVLGGFSFIFLLSGSGLTKKYRVYEITFSHSVSGLSLGGTVNFNGLKVGEVTKLGISEEDTSRVDALVKVDESTPIKVNTKARLETTGVTGVASIALFADGAGEGELTAPPGQRYPRIAAESSQFQTLFENMQQVAEKASVALTKLDTMVDANAAALTSVLKDAATFTKGLAANTREVENFIDDAAELAHSLKPLVGRFNQVLTASETTIKAIDPKKLKTIAGEMASVTSNLNRFSEPGLRQYENLAVDGRKAAESFDRAVRSLERDPSQVIFGPSQSVPEVAGQ